jgi:biofilm PGA synthesis N-glycosyltransferase PgaC
MLRTASPIPAARVMGRKYVLITPCRDEASYARRTLDCVTKQTMLPALWIIVDDGSTDATPEILSEYARRFPFIKVIRRADRGERKLGGGVIDAFYTGFDTIDPHAYDYLCKFDLDLELPADYFENVIGDMEHNPRIGTYSGKPWFGDKNGKQVLEKCGDENSVGMIKFYRTECFLQIGGFVRELMWDGIDGHRCRMLGWIAESSNDPQLRFEHLRPMGTSHKSWWTGRARHGRGQYFMGTGIGYLMASAFSRIASPPVFIGSIAMMWGYMNSLIRRRPRYDDTAFRVFLRRYQWECILRGKIGATDRVNERQARQWVSNASVPLTIRPSLPANAGQYAVAEH